MTSEYGGYGLEAFRVDPGKRFQVWHISGGRTSGMMFRLLLEANGGIPENAEAVFTNTGKEHPKTLDFLREMEVRWGAPITWLEYCVDDSKRPSRGTRTGMSDFRIVDYETASRDGAPFEALMARERRVPNIFSRFCTKELKQSTSARYFSSKGIMPRERMEIGRAHV